jgi:hypothetical protein
MFHWMAAVMVASAVSVPQSSGAASAAQRGVPASRSVFARVFSVDTPGLTAPGLLTLGRMDGDRALGEIGGKVDVEITVGTDGFVRDAMVTSKGANDRVAALGIRAAANSQFTPGTLDGRPVPVRISVQFKMASSN